MELPKLVGALSENFDNPMHQYALNIEICKYLLLVTCSRLLNWKKLLVFYIWNFGILLILNDKQFQLTEIIYILADDFMY